MFRSLPIAVCLVLRAVSEHSRCSINIHWRPAWAGGRGLAHGPWQLTGHHPQSPSQAAATFPAPDTWGGKVGAAVASDWPTGAQSSLLCFSQSLTKRLLPLQAMTYSQYFTYLLTLQHSYLHELSLCVTVTVRDPCWEREVHRWASRVARHEVAQNVESRYTYTEQHDSHYGTVLYVCFKPVTFLDKVPICCGQPRARHLTIGSPRGQLILSQQPREA